MGPSLRRAASGNGHHRATFSLQAIQTERSLPSARSATSSTSYRTDFEWLSVTKLCKFWTHFLVIDFHISSKAKKTQMLLPKRVLLMLSRPAWIERPRRPRRRPRQRRRRRTDRVRTHIPQRLRVRTQHVTVVVPPRRRRRIPPFIFKASVIRGGRSECMVSVPRRSRSRAARGTVERPRQRHSLERACRGVAH